MLRHLMDSKATGSAVGEKIKLPASCVSELSNGKKTKLNILIHSVMSE